jgi:glycosyltransferase involved in cell wall biosynthesis
LQLRLEPHHNCNQKIIVTASIPGNRTSKTSSVAAQPAQPSPRALLLDLAGDKHAAQQWAAQQAPSAEIISISKADLKWGSKHKALGQLRSLSPNIFLVFTVDLDMQSLRSAIMLFGWATGARRIIIGDYSGRTIKRSQSSLLGLIGAVLIETTRLAIELLVGYTIVVPLSWLLTVALSFASRFKKIKSRSRGNLRSPECRKLLYIRATPVAPEAPSAASGGMAAHVAGFARGSFTLGHQLKFIVSGGMGIKAGVEACSIRPSATFSATRALFELWNNLIFTAKSLRAINRMKSIAEFDFIYQRYSRFNWTGVVFRIATGLPLVLEFNGSEVWVSRHWDPVGQLWLLRRFELLNLRAADLISVVSEVEKRRLIAEGVEADKIFVNPNGVDVEEFRPGCGGCSRRALGIESSIVVGFSGTFGPWHGTLILAEAAKLIEPASRLHFLFIGDGDLRPATESKMAEAADRVSATFIGRVAHDRMPAYLDACDILVAPHLAHSCGEFFGSPTKLFEYMAMAKPVVASRLGQIADIIVDGENGLLVEPANPSALAGAIRRLVEDEKLRVRLGEAARRTVIEQYTWKHNAARVFDAFERYLAKS